MRLQDKIALITGGASGIGRATAELFTREGAKVAVADCDAESGQATVQSIRDAGGDAVFVAADVSDSVQIQTMVQVTVDTYGGIDVLFNNAGALLFGTVADTTEQDWRRILDINLTGVFLCSKAVLPHMIERGGGSIINTSSSTGAHDGNGNAAAYVTSKGGVTLLTRCMAIDHAKNHIRVNAIAPGPTDTPMLREVMTSEQIREFSATFPMNRLGRPDEIAQAALFLASDEASFVTGVVLAVDGGQTAQI